MKRLKEKFNANGECVLSPEERETAITSAVRKKMQREEEARIEAAIEEILARSRKPEAKFPWAIFFEFLFNRFRCGGRIAMKHGFHRSNYLVPYQRTAKSVARVPEAKRLAILVEIMLFYGKAEGHELLALAKHYGVNLKKLEAEKCE